MQELEIKIPKAKEEEIVNIPKGTLGELKGHFDKQFGKIDKLLFAIVTSVIVSAVGIVIATFGIVADQMRYNSVIYKEYSEKTKSVETTQKINQELLIQNQKNQEIIIELQKQVLKKYLWRN